MIVISFTTWVFPPTDGLPLRRIYKKVLLLSLLLFYFVDFSSGDEEEESGKKRKHENSLKSEGQLDRRRLVQTEMLLMPDTRA